MHFEIVETLSLPGDPAKPNEDAFAADASGAVVLDGATMVSENLMPGKSDAAWIASFGARRLRAHWNNSDSPRAALRHALADAERSFAGLRRRPPAAPHEWPLASMIFAMPQDGGFEALWYGDCTALVLTPDGTASVVGTATEKKSGEASAAQRFADETGLAPVEALKRAEYLPLFRTGRAAINTPAGEWLFAPLAAASEHVSHRKIAAPAGTLVLLCSDGFLALAGYRDWPPQQVIEAARDRRLAALAEELRAAEAADPDGRTHPRFKPSDDATAMLLKLV